MDNQTSHTPRASSRVRMVSEFLLSKLVNQHTKRIIFITTLYSSISHEEKLERSAMAKLNQLMVLVRDSESLSFPARLGNLVWGQAKQASIGDTLRPEVLHANLSESERLKISESVVDMTPKCLRYLSRPEMVKDVYQLLREYSNLRGIGLPMAA